VVLPGSCGCGCGCDVIEPARHLLYVLIMLGLLAVIVFGTH